ncbi:MAG: TauD/TfdA family dioxygenase [Gammaproteobacteria bacterium]
MPKLKQMQPLSPSNRSDFDTWSKSKLSLYSSDRIERLCEATEISPDGPFQPRQLANLQQNFSDFNFGLYRIDDTDHFDLAALSRLGRRFGLSQLDANLCAEDDRITIITDCSDAQNRDKQRQRYIPYSNRAMGWHTDGYYNPQHQRVRSFILHCAQPAAKGGSNRFMDPDIAYILLRQENPAYIKALTMPDVMRIPENSGAEGCLRSETATSVFQFSSDYRILDMRFSQRKKNVIWRDDAVTQEALACLNELLDSNSRWHIDYHLNAGEGIVTNNVLHRRDAYQDDADHKRVFYRARYYSRVTLA